MAFGACTKDASLSNNPNFSGTELSSANNGGGLLPQVAGGKYIKDAYIVVLKDEVTDVDGEVEQMTKGMGGAKADRVYKHAIKGFSIKVPAAAIQGLSKHPKVAYIEQDQVVTIDATEQTGATWGLDRVDQPSLPLSGSYTYNSNGSKVDAYIFDTGIRYDHVEFGGRAKFGFDAFNNNGNDGNGHGTHVAGTVGGQLYGVAKGIQLFAVRVLDNLGSGSWSGVIAGVDWAVGHHDAARKAAVGNMSLGGGASTSVDDAVRRAVADGIVMCVAAGNSNVDASGSSPARTAQAITVGATDRTDARASYSNFGPILDIFAPGSAITSAWHTSSTQTNTISGTSMASPHVAGVAALYLEAKPGSTPAEVATGLKAVATPNLVASAGTGSPNLLLYSGSFADVVVPPPTVLSVPNLSSPINGITVSTSPTLLWGAVTGATSYDVQVSTGSNFTTLVKNASVSGSSYVASKLRSRTLYYWRVRSKSSSSLSSWSTGSTGTFRTR